MSEISNEKALQELKSSVVGQGFQCHPETYQKAITALEKQIPKEPLWVSEIYPTHDWQLKENGEIDDVAFSAGYCNGIFCNRCYMSYCVHCHSDDIEDIIKNEKCDCSHYICPNCKEKINEVYTERHCEHCGQALIPSRRQDGKAKEKE